MPMDSQSRRTLLFFLVAAGTVLILWTSFHHRSNIQHIVESYRWKNDDDFNRLSSSSSASSANRDAASNQTLGFEKIFALSVRDSWRVRGLQAAAKLTGLAIEYPSQAPWPSELVEAYENIGPDEGAHPGHGSALAWLAHLDLLKYFIQGDWSTAMIMEDDVDWDVELRTRVMPPLVDGVREFTQAREDDLATPYGSNWDVLWFGHCGEWSQDWMPFHSWPDETVVPHSEYVGWARVDMKKHLPEGVRTTHPTTNSVCTFAYGVTAMGARKIIDHVSVGHEEAFDVALSMACRDKKLTCVTIHPEVFHHYKPPSEYGQSSEVTVLNAHENEINEDSMAETMGTTANIIHSARCEALFNSTCQEKPSDG